MWCAVAEFLAHGHAQIFNSNACYVSKLTVIPAEKSSNLTVPLHFLLPCVPLFAYKISGGGGGQHQESLIKCLPCLCECAVIYKFVNNRLLFQLFVLFETMSYHYRLGMRIMNGSSHTHTHTYVGVLHAAIATPGVGICAHY